MRKLIFALALSSLFVFMLAAEGDNKIVIFHAGSLSVPFGQMEKAFEAKYPQYDVQREASGSRNAARKVSDLNKRCEIMASADYTVIDKLLIDGGHASWNVKFVTNEMAIMYTPESLHAKKINKDNWFKILLKRGVEFGHSDPNADPCGYRTLLVWQLAERYYKQKGLYNKLDKACPPSNVRSAEVELIALLEAGQIDYLFIYRSVAEQHKLPYITLPTEINLKDEEYASYYRRAKLDITGSKPGTVITKQGEPMIYGFTIPKTVENREGALLFAQFILSPEGKRIMEQNGQPFLKPVVGTGAVDKIPAELKKLM